MKIKPRLLKLESVKSKKNKIDIVSYGVVTIGTPLKNNQKDMGNGYRITYLKD